MLEVVDEIAVPVAEVTGTEHLGTGLLLHPDGLVGLEAHVAELKL